MRISELLVPDLVVPPGAEETEISAITADSRTVVPGALFAALPGARADGTNYAREAIEKGAAAILAPTGAALEDLKVPVLRADDPRRVLALMAARLHPGQPSVAVAVTGTSGKTSVVEFTRQIFAALGYRAASLGTIGLVSPDGAVYGALTTPDPVSMHRLLSDLAGSGVTHLAFEASSHGLDQRRLDGVQLAAAAFTNLGRDHLDYHSTMEDYLAAKLRLFNTLLEPGRPAVINADDPWAARVIETCRRRGHSVLTTGFGGELLRIVGLEPVGFAQRLRIAYQTSVFELVLPLLGEYQASNALVAAGIAVAVGEHPGRVIGTLAGLKGVKGRLEIVGTVRGGLVVVDYAHKPDALEAALKTLRPFARANLVCIFGCGGDRDRGKRPMMGRIAIENADRVIITDDNPRTEDAAAIRGEILAGAPGAVEIGDRRAAIGAGIEGIGEGDVVLIAGKGHETGQIIGDKTVPYSDHEAARAAIEALTSTGCRQ
jgi:UDP-N-acetylmuramoyl-L-alanyl-D-glutamate--2,6-diaminopimelate ligase